MPVGPSCQLWYLWQPTRQQFGYPGVTLTNTKAGLGPPGRRTTPPGEIFIKSSDESDPVSWSGSARLGPCCTRPATPCQPRRLTDAEPVRRRALSDDSLAPSVLAACSGRTDWDGVATPSSVDAEIPSVAMGGNSTMGEAKMNALKKLCLCRVRSPAATMKVGCHSAVLTWHCGVRGRTPARRRLPKPKVVEPEIPRLRPLLQPRSTHAGKRLERGTSCSTRRPWPSDTSPVGLDKSPVRGRRILPPRTPTTPAMAGAGDPPSSSADSPLG